MGVKAAWFWILLAAGGSAGAVLRYGLSGLVQRASAGTFPWGTLVVNVLGCAVMGVLAKLFIETSVLRPEYRTALLIGVLGAFTTFSTFSYEVLTRLNDGQFRQAAAYVLLTNGGCLLAVWLGFRVAERWLS